MLKKELYIATLVAFLCLGFAGTALAGEVIYDSSEAGDWEFTFDAPGTAVSDAVKNHVYDQESLAKVGTEAGDWEYNPNAPETKADIAARNYDYDQEALATVGTEAGNGDFWYGSPRTIIRESAANEAIADKTNKTDAVCKGC